MVETCFVTQASLLLLVQQLIFYASLALTELYLDQLHFKPVEMHWLHECNLYDLCSTHHLVPNYGRGWLLEWMMAQKMAQEVKRLTLDSKTTTCYTGVYWQPEQKHPWVVELKLPQNKKMWVGNTDTEEEVTQAYDNLRYGFVLMWLSSDDASKLVAKQILESKCLLDHIQSMI